MDDVLPERVSFRTAVAIQFRVVGALVLREMRTRFGHSKLGYVWALGEPFVHIALLATIFSFLGRAPLLGTSMQVFFFTGLVPFMLFNKVSNSLTQTINANRSLLAYPMVRPIDTLIGRTFLESATVLCSSLLVALLFFFLGYPVLPDDGLGVLAAIGAAVLLGAGAGTLNAAITIRFRAWATIWSWIQLPSFIVAGIFFVADQLPETIRDFVWWIPLTHAVVAFRDAYYSSYESNFLSMSFLMLVAFGLLSAGLLVLRASRFKIYE
ncbi:MAG: ABC transporter permease [Pseudomonadota bacterium]